MNDFHTLSMQDKDSSDQVWGLGKRIHPGVKDRDKSKQGLVRLARLMQMQMQRFLVFH